MRSRDHVKTISVFVELVEPSVCVYATEHSYHQKKKDRKTEILAFFVVLLIALTLTIPLNSVSYLMHLSVICLHWKLIRTILI